MDNDIIEKDFSEFKKKINLLIDKELNITLNDLTKKGEYDKIVSLLNYIKNPINITHKINLNVNYNNGTLLKNAIKKNQLELVQLLIDNGADVNIDNTEPMWLAIEKGRLEIIKILVEKGAILNVDKGNEILKTRGSFFWKTLYHDKLEILKFLIEKGMKFSKEEFFEHIDYFSAWCPKIFKYVYNNYIKPKDFNDKSKKDLFYGIIQGNKIEILKLVINDIKPTEKDLVKMIEAGDRDNMVNLVLKTTKLNLDSINKIIKNSNSRLENQNLEYVQKWYPIYQTLKTNYNYSNDYRKMLTDSIHKNADVYFMLNDEQKKLLGKEHYLNRADEYGLFERRRISKFN